MRALRPLSALAVVLGTALVACSSPGPPAPATQQTLQAVEADPDVTWRPQAAPLELGVTHTQDSLDDAEPDDARDRGVDILDDLGDAWQNHHLMGFGTDNPEPSPDDYDWDSLDNRMELTENTGGRPMLTLCCAPDWMKGGREGHTDWDKLEEAPKPEFFDAFAQLAAAAVQRYPQVQRVQVWNEFKGFWDESNGHWNYEAYTELYNKVYTAVKAVRPDIQVGGPYVVVISLDPGSPDASSELSGPWGVADQRTLDVIDYWLKNNIGADFLTVDAASDTRQETVPDPIAGAQKYADIANWIHQRTQLPIWWAEYYPEVPAGESDEPTSPVNAAVNLAAIAAMAESGTAGALLWGPQAHGLGSVALWTDATKDDGGQPTPLTAAWEWLVPRLAKGDVEIGRSAEDPLVVFRAADGAVVVNAGPDAVDVGGADPVSGWSVTVLPRDGS